jgi:hypothetical protein
VKGKSEKEKGKNETRTFAFYLFTFVLQEPPENAIDLARLEIG